MSCCDLYESGKMQYQCQKYQATMCEACLQCKDPDLYCKFRPSCMIHFLEKERRGEKRKA